MVLPVMRWTLAAGIVLAAWGLAGNGASPANAQVDTARGPSDLFYNYYVPPAAGGVGAEMYPCPRPTPPQIGGTYFTYQPLMPQEFLYHHERSYVTYHPDAPPTYTHVHWGGGNICSDLSRFFYGRETQIFRKRTLSQDIMWTGPN